MGKLFLTTIPGQHQTNETKRVRVWRNIREDLRIGLCSSMWRPITLPLLTTGI